ncbi:unnamed protein product [Sympodiomycopsis kandeliae]
MASHFRELGDVLPAKASIKFRWAVSRGREENRPVGISIYCWSEGTPCGNIKELITYPFRELIVAQTRTKSALMLLSLRQGVLTPQPHNHLLTQPSLRQHSATEQSCVVKSNSLATPAPTLLGSFSTSTKGGSLVCRFDCDPPFKTAWKGYLLKIGQVDIDKATPRIGLLLPSAVLKGNAGSKQVVMCWREGRVSLQDGLEGLPAQDWTSGH